VGSGKVAHTGIVGRSPVLVRWHAALEEAQLA